MIDEAIIAKLERIIRDHPRQETEFQDFFETCPQAFCILTIEQIYNKQWAGQAHLPHGIKPDFIIDVGNHVVLIVELENPDLGNMFNRDHYPTGTFNTALHQIERYVSIFRDELSSINRIPELRDCRYVSGLLLAGTKATLSSGDEAELMLIKSHLQDSNIELLTYDEFVQRMRTSSRNYAQGINVITRR